MLKCTFAEVHQLAVSPVSADGEIREVVLPGVEEMTLAADRKIGRSKSTADCAEKESVLVDVVSSLMHPLAFSVFVSP